MRINRIQLAIAAAAVSLAALLIGPALAATSKPVVKAKVNATLSRAIVVDAQGRTLYRLSGETKTALKCTSAACLKAWPPLTVRSAKTKLIAGTGVHGKLSLLHRSGGVLQVMLAGRPLYRFIADKTPGMTSGNGLKTFGGTWNVLGADSAGTGTPTTTTAPTTTVAPPSTPSTTTTSPAPAPIY